MTNEQNTPKTNENNLAAFVALIEKYESITAEEVESAIDESGINWGKTDLTGFGNYTDCTLCKAAGYDPETLKPNCTKCMYMIYTGSTCNKNKNDYTYRLIYMARNAWELLKAYKARAAHMRKILADNNITI